MTEPPTDLLTISPERAPLGSTSFAAGLMYRYPTRFSVVRREPLFVVRAKSSLAVRRAFFGSTL
jgi:hypothetical protein